MVLLNLTVVGAPLAGWLVVRYQLMGAVAMLEQGSADDLRLRASGLVRHRWWHTAVFALGIWAGIHAIGVAIGLLVLVAATGLPLWAGSLVVMAVEVALTPLGGIALTLLYGDAAVEHDQPDAAGGAGPRAQPGVRGSVSGRALTAVGTSVRAELGRRGAGSTSCSCSSSGCRLPRAWLTDALIRRAKIAMNAASKSGLSRDDDPGELTRRVHVAVPDRRHRHRGEVESVDAGPEAVHLPGAELRHRVVAEGEQHEHQLEQDTQPEAVEAAVVAWAIRSSSRPTTTTTRTSPTRLATSPRSTLDGPAPQSSGRAK